MAREITKAGKYKIKDKLAEGGLGAVYRAEHPTLNRTVIIKQLTLKGSEAFTERFKREARIVMDLKNDHIAQVYDHFKEGSSYFIVMEYVDGTDLSALIKRDRYVPREAAMLIFNEICKGLKYAHDRDVIHRDIKADNILISNEGEVKIADFGIATSKEENDDGLTRTGMTLGTPSYMAPEQIEDSKNVDKRADIYSMGVVLYEMMTGEKPFPGGFAPSVISQIHKGKYKPPQKINPGVPAVARKIIKKAMYAKKTKRFRDIGYIIARLSGALKKYHDQNEINNAIKRYVQGIRIPDKKTKAKKEKYTSNFSKIIYALLLIMALLSGGVYYSYRTGSYYEYMKPGEFGALVVDVEIDGRYKEPGDIYLKAAIFNERNNRLMSLKDVKFKFSDIAAGKGKSYSMRSGKVYLRPDNYTLFLNVENKLYHENFYLRPRTVQRLSGATSDSKKVSFRLGKISPLPLEFSYSVRDGVSGREIESVTDVYIYNKKGWIKWDEFRESEDFNGTFKTGKRYSFKFKSDGYYDKSVKTYIEPYQSDLRLDIKLIPVSGALIIKSDQEGTQILLNNSPIYLAGGKDLRYEKLSPLKPGSRKIPLPPGEYFLTASRSSFIFRKISETEKIKIEPDKETVLSVDFDDKAKAINITKN